MEEDEEEQAEEDDEVDAEIKKLEADTKKANISFFEKKDIYKRLDALFDKKGFSGEGRWRHGPGRPGGQRGHEGKSGRE